MKSYTPRNPEQPGEVPFKQWLADQAAPLGLTPRAIDVRIRRGKLAMPKIRKVNQRVIFVKVATETP